MNTDDYFLFFDCSEEGEECGQASWILSRSDGFELHRGEYKIKSKPADTAQCPDAYYSSYIEELIRRAMIIYLPDLVVFSEAEKAYLMRLNQDSMNGFQQSILLDKLGQNRGLKGFFNLKEMYVFFHPGEISLPVGADQVKACYNKLINQDLTFIGKVNDAFDYAREQLYETYQGVRGHLVASDHTPVDSPERGKGVLAIIWDAILWAYVLLLMVAFIAAFISLFIDIGKSIMNHFS